jgi:hypothetical protein
LEELIITLEHNHTPNERGWAASHPQAEVAEMAAFHAD